MTVTHSVWPWKTFTEWIEGSLKSQRRKVVSREEVTTSRWVGCVQQCVSSWSCPTTKDDKNARSPTCRDSQSDTRIKQVFTSLLLTLTVKVNIGSKSKKSFKNSTKARGGTGFPSGAARPLVHAFTGIRKGV